MKYKQNKLNNYQNKDQAHRTPHSTQYLVV